MKKLFRLLEKKKKHRRIIVSREPHPDYPKGSFLDYYGYILTSRVIAGGVVVTTISIPLHFGHTDTLAANLTKYYSVPFKGALQAADEPKIPVTVAGTITRMSVNIYTNTLTAASTLTLRVNGADTTMTITIGAGVTGILTTTTNPQALAIGDYYTIKIAAGATGTSLKFHGTSLRLEYTV